MAISRLTMTMTKQDRSKIFIVGIVWAAMATDLLFYGALIPLIPKYIEELSGIEPDSLNNPAVNASGNYSTRNTTNLQPELNSLTIGTLIALQQWTQLVANFFVGPVIDKIGCDVPLVIGYVIIVISSLGFAFAHSYASLAIMRGLQGVGSSFLTTAGVVVVADMYRDDDKERGKMIGIATCGTSVGLIIGPSFGSLLYEFGNKKAPFITIASITFVLAILQICVRTPRIHSKNPEAGSMWEAQSRLIRDPYVLICALLVVLGYIGMGFLDGVLPLYMLTTMDTEDWMLGAVFLPLYVGFALAIPIMGWVSRRIGRWPVVFASFFISAMALVAYPFCRNFKELLLPGVPLGIGIAAIDAAVFPIMAYLVDTRIGTSVYGSVYALAGVSISLAFGSGPILAGILMPYVGFKGLMFITAGLSLAALVPAALLRKPLLFPESSDESINLINGGKENEDGKRQATTE